MADDIDTLKTDVEELKKQIWNLTRKIIPQLEESIANSGDNDNGGSGEENGGTSTNDWIEIYNMESEDPAVNLDQTSGLLGNSGRLETLPDLANYTQIRLGYMTSGTRHYFDFDITSKKDNFFHLVNYNANITRIFHFQVFFGVRNEKAILEFQTLTTLILAKGAYPSFESKNGTANYGIFRILVK